MNRIQERMLGAALCALTFIGCSKENSEVPAPGKAADKPAETPVNGAPASYQIKIKAAVKVGNLLYDSIPATLTITAWDSLQAPHESGLTLEAGVNTVNLPQGVRYRLQISHWGVTADTLINTADLAAQAQLTITASKAPKFITKEEQYIRGTGDWQPQGRIEYDYISPGMLSNVFYYGKSTLKPGLVLTREDMFAYRNGRLNRINHYGQEGDLETWYAITYGANGNIEGIRESSPSGNGTNATVEQLAGKVKFFYEYVNGNTMNYTQTYRNGNLVEDAAYSSRGGSETSKYQYDLYINPFAQLNYPDMFLGRRSINNRIGEQKNYGGNIPMSVPYQFDYTYDADGYPTQLIVSYKGFTSNEHLFMIKTVYSY